MISTETIDQTVSHIAHTLGESEKKPVDTIKRIVEQFGEDFAFQVLEDTLKIENEGGLKIHEGTRKRTPGGVFFYLVRGRIPSEDVQDIFVEPKVTWKNRTRIIQEIKQETDVGGARVKILLIGRPGRVVEKRDFAITMIRDTGIPTLPKGLPKPPDTPTSYMVYMSKKQWKRVKEAIQNPEDVLIVEGYARYDPELEGVAVFAINAMTKFLQQQRRHHQQQKQKQREMEKRMVSSGRSSMS